jgi:hypothetical protein
MRVPAHVPVHYRARILAVPVGSFAVNSLDGTIPAALSALNSLSYLCVRPRSCRAECRAHAALSECGCCAVSLVSTGTPASTPHEPFPCRPRVPSQNVSMRTLPVPSSGPVPWRTGLSYLASAL